ncbi:hypothetical protein [Seonamhaeicola marinus]|uniref:DUF5017 domain-containing protein n=1 Tax=Seonamhaeicola marinus TaxID=1912246 RepID=A0A5D0HIP2_9FLAO|nr:hypothetical protein [Seonamhaeicola marinus]TYA70159.1 hypothetical protein FUA24_23030 [Seonamhaeicola marinus]
MKNLIYLITLILAVTFVGCNPLDDIYNDLDAAETPGVDFIQGVENYTFTTEDYEEFETELSGEEYFESQDQADLIIPDFLADKYPVWGEGSLVNVGYNLFAETVPETLSTSETISSLSGIDDYLSSNYETATNGTFVELTYNAEVLAYTLNDDDFEAIESALSSKYPEATSSAGRFGNFERRSDRDSYWSDDMILEALTAILASEYNTGQVVVVTFAIYDGSSGSESFVVQHNGYNFLKLDVDATGGSSTAYTLTGDDYDTIAADLAAAYPDPASNLGRFGSFDVRVGSSGNAWTDAMILEALNIVLPAANEGDVYAVTYAIYNGSVGTETVTLLYTGGAYVENATTVEVSAVVAKNDGDWEFPYAFQRADFDTFGFRFPNFSSSNVYILDIFLEDLFPYAQAGDVAMVQYDFFAGGVSTKYGHSIFDGDKWNLTPDVIATSFQYGFEKGAWVPDNTINYTLLGADYGKIVSQFTDKYPDATSSMDRFGNFERRVGNSAEWKDDMVVEALAFLLNDINPSADNGQKYAVTFDIYNGSNGTETFKLIKENGAWVLNE